MFKIIFIVLLLSCSSPYEIEVNICNIDAGHVNSAGAGGEGN